MLNGLGDKTIFEEVNFNLNNEKAVDFTDSLFKMSLGIFINTLHLQRITS